MNKKEQEIWMNELKKKKKEKKQVFIAFHTALHDRKVSSLIHKTKLRVREY